MTALKATPASAPGDRNPVQVWCVTESKAGTLTQCLGVALHLTPEPVKKIVKPVRGIRKLFAPALFRKREAEPQVLISCGFRAEPPVMRIASVYGERPLKVHLQRPRIEGYDLVFVSRHDWMPELETLPGYHKMVGVPHQLSASVIAERRPAARARLDVEHSRVVAVFLGGSNGAYVYDEATQKAIGDAIQDLEQQGWRVLVSVSRRSDDATLQQALSLQSKNVKVWDRKSDNPYQDYVAAADAFLIAKDSITMPCEALTTGRPVYALDLSKIEGPRLQKFEFYHHDLQETLGLTRPFLGSLDSYSYEPLDETGRIAAIVKAALQERASRL